MRHALGVILLLVVGSAQSAPVTYVLDAEMSDGSTITGSFVYEYFPSTTGNSIDGWSIVSDVSLQVSGGTTPILSTGTNEYGFEGDRLVLDADDFFTIGLTSSTGECVPGSTSPPGCYLWVNLTSELRSGDSIWITEFYGPGLEGRGNHAAPLTAVPVPAAVWLLGSGLGLLGWMRKNYFLG